MLQIHEQHISGEIRALCIFVHGTLSFCFLCSQHCLGDTLYTLYPDHSKAQIKPKTSNLLIQTQK